MDNKISIGYRIQKSRKLLNLTQKELAEKSGLKISAIISYENNQREPAGRALAALEKALNVTGSYIFYGDSIFAHHDREIMDAINENWHILLVTLNNSINKSEPLVQKLIFNILVEFKSILNSTTIPNFKKSNYISLVHDIIMSISKHDIHNENNYLLKEE